jgi:hypothetical protein
MDSHTATWTARKSPVVCSLRVAGATLEWQVDRHLTLTLEYGHFFAGPFLEETGPGRDIDWRAATLTYTF